MEIKSNEGGGKTVVFGVTGAIILILLLLGLGAMLAYQLTTKGKSIDIEAYQDTLRTQRLDNGNMVATIRTIDASKVEAFTRLQSRDSTIIQLQKVVEKYQKKLTAGSSVTVLHTETNVNGTDDNIIIIPGDTVLLNNETYVYPQYLDTLGQYGDWITGAVLMTKDSLSLAIKIKHDYSIVVGEEKSGFLGLGKRIPFSEVTDANPYDSVTALRTYQVTVPRKGTVKKLGIGLVIGIIVAKLLL